MVIDVLSTAEVCRRSGVTYRRVDHWTCLGIVKPLTDDRPGSGKQRQWDPRAVPTFKAIGDALELLGLTHGNQGSIKLVARLWNGFMEDRRDRVTIRHGSAVLVVDLPEETR